MIYMSPIPHVPEQYKHRFGYMLSMAGKIFKPANVWMLDNGEFAGKFNKEKWQTALNDMLPFAHSCKGVVVPDVVFDAKKTIDKFFKYKDMIPAEYPIAFVAQNGIEGIEIPWDEFDALFVGGDNKFKMSSTNLIQEANERNKWTHVGRVNSMKRIMHFWMADSCDGTHFVKSSNLLRSCQSFLYACEFSKSKKEMKCFI